MKMMMASASHSPILDFPLEESSSLKNVIAALNRTKERITEFNPDLIIMFGDDHYGGQQMRLMPSFCVGVEATSLADVGGTPGPLNVPRDIAVNAVNFLRQQGVDVAVSYNMETDHGFSQGLKRLTGRIDRYPVLPIFMCCIQPPFVPFSRARALGKAVGNYIKTLDKERILIMGTGGLAHNPEMLFPPIDTVGPEWKPYILNGKTQNEVSQEDWMNWEISAHKEAAKFLVDDNVSMSDIGLNQGWDDAFLKQLCNNDLQSFDEWDPNQVMEEGGIGALELQTWIAAAQAMKTATGVQPKKTFHELCKEIGTGFGIVESGPELVL